MSSASPRVLVTRAAEDAQVLSYALGVAGFESVEVPLLRRLWQVDAMAEVSGDETFDWVIVTSATTADVMGVAAPAGWPGAHIAAVGPSTQRRLESMGCKVDLVPARATGRDLVAALGDLTGQRVLYPRASIAEPDTADALRAAGADLVEVVAYTNEAPPRVADQLVSRLPVDATTLLSGSAARRLAGAIPETERMLLGKIVVIGPSTGHAARAEGLPVHAMANPHTVKGIVSAVRQLFPRDIQ